MTRVEFRRATQADALKFYHQPAIRSFRGYVAVLGGKVIGIGGIYYDYGVPIAFSEMTDEMRNRRRDKARAVRLLEDLIDAYGAPVFAVVEPGERTAPYLLAKLGFQPTGQFTERGELLVKRPR